MAAAASTFVPWSLPAPVRLPGFVWGQKGGAAVGAAQWLGRWMETGVARVFNHLHHGWEGDPVQYSLTCGPPDPLFSTSTTLKTIVVPCTARTRTRCESGGGTRGHLWRLRPSGRAEEALSGECEEVRWGKRVRGAISDECVPCKKHLSLQKLLFPSLRLAKKYLQPVTKAKFGARR